MKMLKAIWTYVLCLLIVAAVVLLASCTTTKFVEVEKVVKDTTYITKQQRDSVWLHDSIYVRENGDTLWVEQWHTKYVEKLRTDTVYRARIDSVPVPYPVEKLVERQLTWWQKLKMGLGVFFLGIMVAAVAYGIYRLRSKFL